MLIFYIKQNLNILEVYKYHDTFFISMMLMKLLMRLLFHVVSIQLLEKFTPIKKLNQNSSF